jgi:hypothetical protein
MNQKFTNTHIRGEYSFNRCRQCNKTHPKAPDRELVTRLASVNVLLPTFHDYLFRLPSRPHQAHHHSVAQRESLVVWPLPPSGLLSLQPPLPPLLQLTSIPPLTTFLVLEFPRLNPSEPSAVTSSVVGAVSNNWLHPPHNRIRPFLLHRCHHRCGSSLPRSTRSLGTIASRPCCLVTTTKIELTLSDQM